MFNQTKECSFYEKQNKDFLKCLLCPRYCIIGIGQTGFCGARKNINNKLIAQLYGKSSGFSIDPVEKKPLYHFLPGTNTLSFGSIGCNLNCLFCQNWHISRSTNENLLSDDCSPDEIAMAAIKSNCNSVSFTYNEPIINAEFIIHTALACKKYNLKTIAVTSGYISDEARSSFFENIDAINIDLKSFNNDFYKNYCAANLNTILDTLLYLKRSDKFFEITTLIINGLNDGDLEIENMLNWIVDNLGDKIPIHFSAFYPNYKMLTHPPTKPDSLIKIRAAAMAKGIKYVYTGNINDKDGSTTFCAKCSSPLIVREQYTLNYLNLNKNQQCKNCSETCIGVFK